MDVLEKPSIFYNYNIWIQPKSIHQNVHLLQFEFQRHLTSFLLVVKEQRGEILDDSQCLFRKTNRGSWILDSYYIRHLKCTLYYSSPLLIPRYIALNVLCVTSGIFCVLYLVNECFFFINLLLRLAIGHAVHSHTHNVDVVNIWDLREMLKVKPLNRILLFKELILNNF